MEKQSLVTTNDSKRSLGAMIGVLSVAICLMRMEYAFADDTVIIAGVHFPPVSYVDEDTQIHGPGIDSVNAVFDQLSSPYRWIGLSQNRLYREIELGNVDVTIATKKGNHHDDPLIFTRKPISCLSVNIYNSPYAKPLTKIEDLSGSRLLYFYYFEAEDLLTDLATIPDIQLSPTNHRSSAMIMLKMARTDYYLDFRLPATEAMQAANTHYDYMTIHEEPLYLAVVRSKPGATQLINQLEAIMERDNYSYQPPDKPPTNTMCPNGLH